MVAGLIEERIARGHRPRDLAILVRSNSDADPFLRALNVKGLPHRFTGNRGLYAREEVRLLVSFLRALASPDDSVPVFHLAGGELYAMPERDLIRLNRHAARKNRPLLEVLRGLPTDEELAGIGGSTREAAARLVADLDAATEDVPGRRTGEVLYRFLQASGLWPALEGGERGGGGAGQEHRALLRDREGYGDVAEHDRVPAFVAHLDLLREAGTIRGRGADPDDDAVPSSPCTRPRGSSSRSCSSWAASSRSSAARRARWSAGRAAAGGDAGRRSPPARGTAPLLRGHDAGQGRADPDLRRRLRTARAQVSRFAVEALDLPSPAPAPRKSQALKRWPHQPTPPETARPDPPLSARETLTLSFRQIDDYWTCPLKYKFIHRLKVPLLVHHRVVYGSAVHKAVQAHFRARAEGLPSSEDDVIAAFRAAWVSEGFLSREHEEQRLRAGEEALRRCLLEEARAPLTPTGAQPELAFPAVRTKLQWRYYLRGT